MRQSGRDHAQKMRRPKLLRMVPEHIDFGHLLRRYTRIEMARTNLSAHPLSAVGGVGGWTGGGGGVAGVVGVVGTRIFQSLLALRSSSSGFPLPGCHGQGFEGGISSGG